MYEESIFITVGNQEFKIPREVFSDPGNSPNYFSLGFAVFFSSPTEVFPGLNRDGLLRPPSILPPSKSPFVSLGYQAIWSLSHERYFIYIHRLLPEPLTSPISNPSQPPTPSLGYVHYLRPFTDSSPHELTLEIGDSATLLHWNTMRLEFFGETKLRMGKLLEVVATKLNLPVKQPLGLLMKNGGASSEPATPELSGPSEEMVRVVIEEDCGIFVDGRSGILGVEVLKMKMKIPAATKAQVIREERWVMELRYQPFQIRILEVLGHQKTNFWIIKTGQWRLRIQNHGDVVLLVQG
ncbi:hypothetical protein DID88_008437 [Monilinia fructigena]|uniref:Uncharacterized protein n=1 Tax=Monilinia fructigena TaxID=38457 RepID=A0A395J617_9HELO|nr:hypothetical protein DID88_008437 [Monilinia fructigena]